MAKKKRKLEEPRTPEERRAIHRGLSKLYGSTYGRYGTWPAHKKAVEESKKGVFLGRRLKRRRPKTTTPPKTGQNGSTVIPGSQADVYRKNLNKEERKRYNRSK